MAELQTLLNIDLTLDSGQVFLWNKLNDHWYGIEEDNIVKVAVNGDLDYSSYPESIDCRKIFRFDDDLNSIMRKVSKDQIIKQALSNMRGLRLMRQNPYQCLISFMCATNTSVFMIKHMLTKLCNKFGKKIEYDNFIFHTFPEPESLAVATNSELRECSVGYRARFIRKAAKTVSEGQIDFDHLRKASYESAKTELMDVLGVGQKVADCILLFSLEKLDSFPIDVWIARALMNYYGHLFEEKLESDKMSPRLYRILSAAMRDYFGPYAGYAQQYLYCHARSNKIKSQSLV